MLEMLFKLIKLFILKSKARLSGILVVGYRGSSPTY